MDSESRVSISLREGKIEIVGSEQFIREQLEVFMPLIKHNFSAIPVQTPLPAEAQRQPVIDGGSEKLPGSGENPYLNVFALDGETIKILKTPQAKKAADKMINLSLLYLLASAIKGVDAVSYDDLRQACQDHACLDSPNFAAAMKRAKSYFIVSGKGKKTAKLTHPGRTAADNLAKELNEK